MARATTILFVILIVFVVGGILLQIFLSKRESKWPGLVLPALTALYSVVMFIPIYWMGQVMPTEALTIIAQVAVGGLIYGGLLIVFRDPAFLAAKKSLIKRKK